MVPEESTRFVGKLAQSTFAQAKPNANSKLATKQVAAKILKRELALIAKELPKIAVITVDCMEIL